MVTAVVLEALQVFTPDRHADFHAALYGACGALTQALLAALLIGARAAYYRHRFLKRQVLWVQRGADVDSWQVEFLNKLLYVGGMLWRNSRGRPLNAPAAFIHPCQPTVAKEPPSGPGWAHELKHDGIASDPCPRWSGASIHNERCRLVKAVSSNRRWSREAQSDRNHGCGGCLHGTVEDLDQGQKSQFSCWNAGYWWDVLILRSKG